MTPIYAINHLMSILNCCLSILIGSDAITEVHNPDNLTYEFNQSKGDAQIMPSSVTGNCFEKSQILLLNKHVSDLIYVSETIKLPMMNCINVNLEYKSAKKALTTELDRYKEEVKDLKERQNVENNFLGSNEQYAEIERLKWSICGYGSMMTKSKICYDHSTKQAIGFEKPFYLKKVRESKPKLYDWNVILKMDVIVIPDSDETLMHCEESRDLVPAVDHLLFHNLQSWGYKKGNFLSKYADITSLKAYTAILMALIRFLLSRKEEPLPQLSLRASVTKLVAENEHLKQTYKQLYDSIKPKRVQSKEQCDELIKQVNIKSGEISNLNAKLQEQGSKDFLIVLANHSLQEIPGNRLDSTKTPSCNSKNKNDVPFNWFTTTNEVPSRKPIVLESKSPKPVVHLVYSREPRKNKNTESVSKTKVIKPISANIQEPSKSWGSTKTIVPSTSLNECRLSKSSSGIWTSVAQSNDEIAISSHITDNRTEFLNQTLREYYEKVGISHETSVARSPQQNGVDSLPNPPSLTPFVPPSRSDWDSLFQPMFDKLFNPLSYVDLPAPEVIAPILKVVAPENSYQLSPEPSNYS
ncbi:retrovirus-related pol polyprotein from transposon TNT 1-94 [Tanacetum coccineum]|uniref:Retrovirus-related pol polyprotein from transposon TNT 1-94 n=1 Tax=Tanacetum coccineum TaxID=301880 RepID=A0ABQ4YKQ1_9ASTR